MSRMQACAFSVLLLAGLALAGQASAQEALCEDTCPSAADGECDDGGPDSLYDICPLGTDCTDCGARVIGEEPPDTPGVLCEDTCPSAADGECDDGGPDSLYDICPLGTDCTDCGPRVIEP